MVLAERGSQADEVLADDIPGDEPVYPGMTYEVNHVIEFSEEIDERQAGVLIQGFFRRWTNQHPNLKVEYQGIDDASKEEAEMMGLDPQKSYVTTTQITRPKSIETASITTAAAIGAAIAAALSFIAAYATEIVIVSAVIASLYLIYETIMYIKETITGEKTYVCRKHDEAREFDSYAAFTKHYKTAHPDEEVPPEKTGVRSYIKWGAVGIAGVGVLSIFID